jgi:hypothetical protein
MLRKICKIFNKLWLIIHACYGMQLYNWVNYNLVLESVRNEMIKSNLGIYIKKEQEVTLNS